MKKVSKFIPGLLLLAACIVGAILLPKNRTDIIIYNSPETYRTYQRILYAGFAASAVLLTLPVIPLLKERHRNAMSEQLIKAARKKQREAAPLSIRSGRFNEDEIRRLLTQALTSAPDIFIQYLEDYQSQLDRMNSYQERLSTLLKNNGADDLTEPAAFLDKLEQGIFETMRWVFNWINMYDESSPDVDVLKSLDDARANINHSLEAAGSLCKNVTAYINGQCQAVDITSQIKQYSEMLKEELTV